MAGAALQRRPGWGGGLHEAETGRGLLLVTTLSAEWGFYRTSGGKAVYFTLDFPLGDWPQAVPAAGGAVNGAGEAGTGRPG